MQQADLSFAFDGTENLQATDMTLAEMQETQGAAGPWGAVIGGAVGAASGFYGGWAGQVGGKVGTAIFGSTSVGLGVIAGKC